MAVALGLAVSRAISDHEAEKRLAQQHDLSMRQGELGLRAGELGLRQGEQNLKASELSYDVTSSEYEEWQKGQGLRDLAREAQTIEGKSAIEDLNIIAANSEVLREYAPLIEAGNAQAYVDALNALNAGTGVTYELTDSDGFKNGLTMRRRLADGTVENFVEKRITSGTDALGVLDSFTKTIKERVGTAEGQRQAAIASQREMAIKMMEHQQDLEVEALKKSPSDKELFDLTLRQAMLENGYMPPDVSGRGMEEYLATFPRDVVANIYASQQMNLRKALDARVAKTGFRDVESFLLSGERYAIDSAKKVAETGEKTSTPGAGTGASGGTPWVPSPSAKTMKEWSDAFDPSTVSLDRLFPPAGAASTPRIPNAYTPEEAVADVATSGLAPLYQALKEKDKELENLVFGSGQTPLTFGSAVRGLAGWRGASAPTPYVPSIPAPAAPNAYRGR